MKARQAPGVRALLLAGAFAPYYLNDLVFIAQPGWAIHYTADIGARILSLACLFLIAWPPALPPVPARPILALSLCAGAVLLAVNDAIWLDRLLRPLLPLPALVVYPEIPIPALAWLDVWVGLMLVALSEEVAFRAFLMRWLLAMGQSRTVVLLASAILFALIHWSGGLLQVAMAITYGVILGLAYLFGRTILWPILTHYIVNIIYFTV